MAVQILKERYSSTVGAVKLGATREEGGTRGVSYTVGGEGVLPFQHYEGDMPNRPLVAMEVNSMNPNWNDNLKNEIGMDLMSDPVAWAKFNKATGADLIYFKLDSADPDNGGDSPEKLASMTRAILDAVDLPMVVVGSGNNEADPDVLARVAEETKGEKLLMGFAETAHYQSLVAACLGNGHSIIARSPLDINICKQLNILINEMNMPLDRIVIDPLVSSVGYGIEYAYSVMERGRSGALQGDKMLSMPMICTAGFESWRQKESWANESDFPAWGNQEERGPAWEATTVVALLQGGADILCMRHPKAVQAVKHHIDLLMQK